MPEDIVGEPIVLLVNSEVNHILISFLRFTFHVLVRIIFFMAEL